MRRSLVPILFAKPGWVLPGATVDMDFANNRAWRKGGGLILPASLLTTTRASNETSLLPTSAAGAAYLTFTSNVPAIVPGFGLQSYQAATNLLLNSAAPATQTTASLGTGTYTLWVNGTGSATSSAGTATGSSFGAATNGNPNTFTLTGAGTVTVTVSGALNAFQLQSGALGTPFVVTTGVTAAQAADVITFNSVAPFANGFGAFISVGAIPSFAATVHYLSAAGGNRIFYSSSSANLSTFNGTTVLSADPLSGDLSGGFRGAARLKTSDRAIAVKSGTVATDSNTNGVPATVYIGSLNGTGSQNAYTKRIAIFSTLTNAQIASMAALP